MSETEKPRRLSEQIRALDPEGAAERLQELDDAEIAETLAELGPGYALEILDEFTPERRERIAAATRYGEGAQWLEDANYPDGSVGRLMERPAVFRQEIPVANVVASLREVLKHHFVTYIFAVDGDGRLTGVITFRELLYARAGQSLADVMLRNPFSLRPDMTLVEAMRQVVTRHYPVYPVCDGAGLLIGQVRGQWLFEQQAFEISAQAGALVGVEKEERVATPWPRALRFRHPWLQLNLLTAFVAAAVVGLFQHTVNEIVLLAVFLPVLSGQCSNTGCQALAVTLRGITLDEIRGDRAGSLMAKEALLGLCNGLLVGLIAATAMFGIAHFQHNPHALPLALITLVAMSLSSVASGVAGAAVPLGLKRLGADPAMASSIFLTTATDVVSMGLFLGMATWLVV